MTTNATDPMIGRLLDGRYQIRSRIARGGMATVYLATDLRLERRVAIKVMHGHLADDSKFKERFIQEARSAARLAHPNVVNVFDQGQDNDMAYLVMEYLPGITLRDLLQEHGSLTTEQTLDILESVLSGLAAAHKAGIVHRDLKPENVMLADDGRIKIGDFGLARAASANTATGAALLGTIAYLSPELVTRGVADTRSDIYAVGIMTYEMLTGEQPFKGEQPMQIAYQHANDTVPAPSTVNKRVPPELDELVGWATERDPEQRPRDARALLDQVHEAHTGLRSSETASTATGLQRTMVMPRATAAPPATFGATDVGATDETQVLGSRGAVAKATVGVSPAQPSERRRRRWWLIALLALLVAAAGATGWYFWFGPGSMTTIPSQIEGMSEADARAELENLGLIVAEVNGEANSPTVPIGSVANTDPAVGTSVANGSEVQLLISIGPAQLVIPTLIGLTEDAAKSAIDQARFTYDRTIEQFDPEVERGTVLDALDAEGASLTGRETYGEQQPITLVVSVGPLPDLAGLSVEQAWAEVANAGLEEGAVREEEYSDTVPQGAVLRVQLGDGTQPVRVGDTVDLITSKGVEPVLIPDVVGQSWAQARPQLIDAGFRLSYSPLADINPEAVIVSDLTPDGGTLAERGSQVSVSFSF